MTPTHPDTAARWFVRAVTVIFCLAAGYFVTKQGGASLPVHDEWGLYAQYLTQDPVEYLFSHHNEHRYPVSKLLWAIGLKATGDNFRGPMYMTVGLLTAAAVLFQWTARRVRGFAHPVDALSAVVLLHWGHCTNFLMGYQVGFVWVVYAVAGWAWCGVNWGDGRRTGWAWGSAVYAAAVIPTGGFGVIFTPAVVGWLGFLAFTHFREKRWASAVGFSLLAAAASAYTGWIVATTPPISPVVDPISQPDLMAVGTARYMSGALGYWEPEHDDGPVRWWVTVAVVLVYAAAFRVAGGWLFARGSQRRVVGGVLLLLLGSAVLCGLVTTRTRGEHCLGRRFATPSAVGLAVAVVAAGGAVRTGRWGSVAAAVGVLAVGGGIMFLTDKHGRRHGFNIRQSHEGILADLKAGTPPTVLSGRHGGSFGVIVGDDLKVYAAMFKRIGFEPFRDSPDDPPYVLVSVAGAELRYPAPVRLPPLVVPPPVGLGNPDIDHPPYMVLREVKLPPPPSGAVAVRWRTMLVRPINGQQRLTCRWTDPATGEERSSIAYPNSIHLTTHQVFTFDGRPTDLTISGADGLYRIEAMDWLVVP